MIGFSGGPDSTCLTAIMADIASQWKFSLACGYLDHGLRPEEERQREREHVNSFCRERGIKLHTRVLEPGTLEHEARAWGLSLEEAARRSRRDFFRSLRETHSFSYLVLGHTLDDQLETVLFRIFQGSGPAGLRAMRARTDWILRPFLSVPRREIIAYLGEHALASITDSTNRSGRFLRNRVRLKLIPVLRDIFPGMGRSLSALRLKSALMDDFVRRAAHDTIPWEHTASGVKTSAAAFRKAAPAVRLYALYRGAGLIRSGAFQGKSSVPFRFLKPCLVKEPVLPRRIDLSGHGIHIRLNERHLFLERSIVVNRKKGYFIPISPGIAVPLPDCRLELRLPETVSTSSENLICAFDAEKVALPIVVRSRRPGDGIDLGFGTKKLKKLFSELKIDEAERDAVPVLEDAAGVLAVLGVLSGKKNFVRFGAAVATPDTRRLLTLHLLPAAPGAGTPDGKT